MAFLFPRVACAPVRAYPLRHEIAPLFNLFDETFSQLERAPRQTTRPFHPRFDVKEATDSYLLEGELPGFDSKDISIEFTDDGHTLQIKGRTETHTESGERPQAKAVAAAPEPAESTTTPSGAESATAKSQSHQATVEDEGEQSTVAAPTPETKAEPTTVTEHQVTPTQRAQPPFRHWISERRTGEFSRSFSFPSRVDQEAVRASLKDGILSVTLPFAQKPESRRIPIE